MSDQRKYLRTQLSARIRVCHEEIGEKVFNMRDLSDGGIYVIVDNNPFPEIGSHVEVQVQGLPIPAPIRVMRVVREGEDGYGLEFVDESVEGADQ